MTFKDKTDQLHSRVSEILSGQDREVFESYWNVGQKLLEGSPVRGFFISGDDSYANLSVLTDAWMFDITGDENEDEGSLNATQLRAVGQIEFHEDPIPDIPESNEAELLLLVFQLGAPNEYRYWLADDEDEAEELLSYGRAIVEAIARLY